jgi:hypothetical protein
MLHAMLRKPCSGPFATMSALDCTATVIVRALLWNSRPDAGFYRGRLGAGVRAVVTAANGERLIQLIHCVALRVLHVLWHR